jgi:2-amino-4-hydroxy-6-hydroxymethyldihydropteridine diphosphokinase
VLRPLADLAPQVVHPIAGRSIADLWLAFPGDRSGLEPVDRKQ